MAILELISAFVDGELNASRHDTVVAALTSNGGQRSAWARYHLIGEILREYATVKAGREFTDGVRAMIDAEPRRATAIGTRRHRPPTLAGVALAASLIIIVMLAIRPATGPAPVAAVAGNAPAAGVATEPGSGARAMPQIGDVPLRAAPYRHNRRLNSYVVNFNEHRSSLGVPGVPPYVRIVSVEAQ